MIKLESVNHVIQSAHKQLLSNVGVINLSDSDIEEQQDLIENIPVVVQVEPEQSGSHNIQANNTDIAIGNDSNVPSTSNYAQNDSNSLVTDEFAGPSHTLKQLSGSQTVQTNNTNSATGNGSNLPSTSSSARNDLNSLITDELAGPSHAFKQNVSEHILFLVFKYINYTLGSLFTFNFAEMGS